MGFLVSWRRRWFGCGKAVLWEVFKMESDFLLAEIQLATNLADVLGRRNKVAPIREGVDTVTNLRRKTYV